MNQITTLQSNEAFLTEFGQDLQAHILFPHRQDHVRLLYLRFTSNGLTQKAFLPFFRSYSQNAAKTQGLFLATVGNQDARQKNSRHIFFNLYFSDAGLEALGCRGQSWENIIEHLQKNRYDLPNNGQQEESNPSIHGLAMLASNNPLRLEQTVRRFKDHCYYGGIAIIEEQPGMVFRQRFFTSQKRGFTIEHFGYADGLSRPWLTLNDAGLSEANEAALTAKTSNWNPVCGVEDFLVQEPTSADGPKRYGSYLVYRKYEQNVRRFDEVTKDLAAKLQVSQDEAGSLVFGRQKNGNPLSTTTNDKTKATLNNFNYRNEHRCPFFAHIRKVNPRLDPLEGFRNKILRRGITYGDRATFPGYHGIGRRQSPFRDTKLPETGVGLHFLSFQRDIKHFQNILAHSQTPEIDPILGDLSPTGYHYEHRIAGLETPYLDLNQFVKTVGGENFYAPSLSFFRTLK